MATDTIVKFTGVNFHYGNVPALTDVNLEVARGQVFGIVGPNGGGKSTLLKLIAELLKPDSGKIEFHFKKTNSGRIGYMPQRAAVNWKFPIRVIDVITMGLYAKIGLFRQPGANDRKTALEAADRMSVRDLSGRHISELSGGQQQRVFIARAIAAKPELLLLDEPAANMDPESQDRLYKSLESLRDDLGLTIMLVTHDMAVIPKICSQVACVNRLVAAHDEPEHKTCPIATEYLGTEKEIFLHGDFPHRMVTRKKGDAEHTH
jgi:ABC-type Mn2+/Zn2+ transport system ATPase subunit